MIKTIMQDNDTVWIQFYKFHLSYNFESYSIK